jgi:hypothetical protein
MQWYDPLLIIVVVIGLLLILFGSYHGHQTIKSGVVGWIMVFVALTIRVGIWILGMT